MILFTTTLLVVSFVSAASKFAWDGKNWDDVNINEFRDGQIVTFFDGNEMCDSWVLVPGFQLYATWIQAILLFTALVYTFLGVAIIADKFMEAIEVITSKEKKTQVVTESGGREWISVKIWNPTVANLSLMALGSSAPEILLSVLETVQNLGKEPGELGPSTIVGSAAFNLLVISAVCVVALPEGEIKKVDQVGVFFVTSIFSLFAYLWMYLVLSVWTPDEITSAEAWITLCFFPLLLIISYAVDRAANKNRPDMLREDSGTNPKDFYKVLQIERLKRQFSKQGSSDLSQSMRSSIEPRNKLGDSSFMDGQNPSCLPCGTKNNRIVHPTDDPGFLQIKVKKQKQGVVDIAENMLMQNGVNNPGDLSTKALAQALKKEPQSVVGRLKYRKNLGRGGHKHVIHEGHEAVTDRELEEQDPAAALAEHFGWKTKEYAVLEGKGHVIVTIIKKTRNYSASIGYKTYDIDALAGSDYIADSGMQPFTADEYEHDIKIGIIDDDQYEEDKIFGVRLFDPATRKELTQPDSECIVTIIDDDNPGVLEFTRRLFSTTESSQRATIGIKRVGGAAGIITARVKTIQEHSDHSALPHVDYVPVDTTISFQSGEVLQEVEVEIIEKKMLKRDDSFLVELSHPSGGVKISKRNTCIVEIVEDTKIVDLINKVEQALKRSEQDENETWSGQFRQAILLEGEEDEHGNLIEPSGSDALFHFLAMGWKVLFALVPPKQMAGGWACFGISLMFIGAITALVGELAGMLGCFVGLEDAVTAITLVAIGTSLPDTFASSNAAIGADNADDAIGNVTGSNSVNVFLGLGLPWVIATIYYTSTGDKFCVPAGDLAFSVSVFIGCAVLALCVLTLRRKLYGGELGGPKLSNRITAVFFVFLWCVYAGMSTMSTYGVIDAASGDVKCSN